MPKREKLLNELAGEQDLGVLLMTQMDGVPDTIQVAITTTKFDSAVNGLREQTHYVIRCVGVREHQISVGLFHTIKIVDEHPLLYQYNEIPVGVFFRGKAQKPTELVLDVFQAHASTFGPWRHVPDYLNTSKPLTDLLASEGDLVGEMPKPLAERMQKVLEHHQLETKLIEGKLEAPLVKALVMDESYVIAMDFTVEELGKAGK